MQGPQISNVRAVPGTRHTTVDVAIGIGTTFTNFFPDYGNFVGTVMDLDQSSGWYLVQYSDGDSEHLDPVQFKITAEIAMVINSWMPVE